MALLDDLINRVGRQVGRKLAMYVTSGGADSPRGIRLRTKKSTGEWFVNSFDGLFSGIRKPKDEDPWA